MKPESRDYRWVLVNGRAGFAPRDGAGALVYRDRMWLLGGWNPSDKVNFPMIRNNEVWSSADGASWELVRANSFIDENFDPECDWEGRHYAGYEVFKGGMWIIGGDPNQGHIHRDVWRSEDGANWKRIVSRTPWEPRVWHYTAVHDGRIWVMGGQTMPDFTPGEYCCYSDVWNSEDGENWNRAAAEAPWAPRGLIGGGVVFNGRIWLLGGGTYDTRERPGRNYYNDVWSSSDGINWELRLEHAPWHPRQMHETAVFDGKMWVLEGFSAGNRNDVWFSPDGVNWTELPGTPWKPRHAASVFVFRNALWVVAGNNMESDVWKLEKIE